MASAELGPVELELIEPKTGESIWANFPAEHGSGLHHVRFNVPDMASVIAYLAGHDFCITQMASGVRNMMDFRENAVKWQQRLADAVLQRDGRTAELVLRDHPEASFGATRKAICEGKLEPPSEQ